MNREAAMLYKADSVVVVTKALIVVRVIKVNGLRVTIDPEVVLKTRYSVLT